MEKVVNFSQIDKIVQKLRSTKKTIVLAGGCFDILHLGHLKFLEQAKKQGDILIIALESDENVKRLKGQNRPINKEKPRAANLLKTGFVDYVVILPTSKTDASYLNLVKAVSPDIIAVTAGDPKLSQKQEQAKTIGSQVKVVIDRLLGFSTSQFLNNI
ncbi:adenylyltransferase/cytidyltransferase family protein [Candidatus Gottesmanbacteria bacterium]|nr:adenylyltransferase/cytidyltransferase family protein [Candidatus Gottesmanbacteria bacterium]